MRSLSYSSVSYFRPSSAFTRATCSATVASASASSAGVRLKLRVGVGRTIMAFAPRQSVPSSRSIRTERATRVLVARRELQRYVELGGGLVDCGPRVLGDGDAFGTALGGG